MAGRFQGEVAVVTGGSSGIGRGIVTRLVNDGCNVLFCSNNEPEGTALEKELNTVTADRGTSKFVPFAANNEESIKVVIQSAIAIFGRLDYLVNNVGQHPPPLTADATESEQFKDLFEINVLSYFLATKFALPHLRKTRGSVVNIASLVASIGQKAAVAYCATKGAIVSMTKAMAIDEAANGVRFNSISPGNIWTPLWESLANLNANPQFTIEKAKNEQVLGRLGTSEDCAGACVFLLSSDADFLTGVDLPVTGGAELNYGIKTAV